MRFMILVKATRDSEAGVMPGGKLIAEMADYHEQLAKSGALLDASGLQASSNRGAPVLRAGRLRSQRGHRTLP